MRKNLTRIKGGFNFLVKCPSIFFCFDFLSYVVKIWNMMTESPYIRIWWIIHLIYRHYLRIFLMSKKELKRRRRSTNCIKSTLPKECILLLSSTSAPRRPSDRPRALFTQSRMEIGRCTFFIYNLLIVQMPQPRNYSKPLHSSAAFEIQ